MSLKQDFLVSCCSTAPKFKICVNDVFCPVLVAVLKGELSQKKNGGLVRKEVRELTETLDKREGRSELMLYGEGCFLVILHFQQMQIRLRWHSSVFLSGITLLMVKKKNILKQYPEIFKLGILNFYFLEKVMSGAVRNVTLNYLNTRHISFINSDSQLDSWN